MDKIPFTLHVRKTLTQLEKDMCILAYKQRQSGKTYPAIANELRQISEDVGRFRPYSPSMAKRLSIIGKSYMEVSDENAIRTL